jgi:hypothetical protein
MSDMPTMSDMPQQEMGADEVLREDAAISLSMHCPICDGKKWVTYEWALDIATGQAAPAKVNCAHCGYLHAITGELTKGENSLNAQIAAESAEEMRRAALARQEAVNRAAAAHNPEPQTRLERIVIALIRREDFYASTAQKLVDHAVNIAKEIAKHE